MERKKGGREREERDFSREQESNFVWRTSVKIIILFQVFPLRNESKQQIAALSVCSKVRRS